MTEKYLKTSPQATSVNPNDLNDIPRAQEILYNRASK